MNWMILVGIGAVAGVIGTLTIEHGWGWVIGKFNAAKSDLPKV